MNEEPDASAWLSRRGPMMIAIVATLLPIPVYWICGRDEVKTHLPASVPAIAHVGEQESRFEDAQQGPMASEPTGQAMGRDESSPEVTLDVDSLVRELIHQVFEGEESDAREVVTSSFLGDLTYNRAVLRNADLDRLQLVHLGQYWILASVPYQFPLRPEGVLGRGGLARLRLVFMDGRWKLHELYIQ